MKEDRVELAIGETITINEVTYKCTRCIIGRSFVPLVQMIYR